MRKLLIPLICVFFDRTVSFLYFMCFFFSNQSGDWAACNTPSKESDPHPHNMLTVLFHDKKQFFFLTNVQTAEPYKKQYRVFPEVAHLYNRNTLG